MIGIPRHLIPGWAKQELTGTLVAGSGFYN